MSNEVMIKLANWAKEHGVSASRVIALLRENGVSVLTPFSDVPQMAFASIEAQVMEEMSKLEVCKAKTSGLRKSQQEKAAKEKAAAPAAENKIRAEKSTIFFAALLADELTPNGDPFKKINAVKNAVNSTLKPYRTFLSNAKKSLESRLDYECKFQELNESNSYDLSLKFKRYSIQKRALTSAIIKLDPNILKEDKKNRLLFEDTDEEITFLKKDAKFSPDQKQILHINAANWDEEISKNSDGSQVELNGHKVHFEKKEILFSKGEKLIQNGNQYIIRSSRDQKEEIIIELEASKTFPSSKDTIRYQGKELKLSPITEKPAHLYFTNGKEWSFCTEKNEYFSTDDEKVLRCPVEMKDEKGNLYILRNYSDSKFGKKSVSIRLMEDDNLEEGEKSSCEYFFENEALKEIYQGEKSNKFKVFSINPEEHKIRIEKHSEKGNILDPRLPVKMVIDTNNLKRQLYAIRNLCCSPVKEHRKLIKLFEKKDLEEKHSQSLWGNQRPTSIKNWFVLTKEQYDGTNTQRKFVEKAIATDDFMLLEGPPGSGKTTAILELILQFIDQGKRVLLTASTHVAIDNILERIQSFKKVSPIRIGKNDSIGESVKNFSLNSRIAQLTNAGWEEESAKRFLLDASNLICGTTMGIQNHPDFSYYSKDSNQQKTVQAVPFYDVMIIDEASKTTFPEFIVPARYAKKWIIVGDIQQLAPYSETEYLKAHLKESVSVKEQNISLLNFRLDSLLHTSKKNFPNLQNQNNFHLALELPKGISIEDFKKTLYNKIKFESSDRKIAYMNNCEKFYDLKSDSSHCWLDLYSKKFSLLITENGKLKELNDYIPEFFHRISFYKFKISESLKRRQKLLYGKNDEKFLKVNEDLVSFFSKEWVDEISWRLIRKFERRHLNKESIYEKDLKKLIPEDHNAENVLNDIEQIFFPSILELLQKGSEADNRYETTLTKGFKNFKNPEIFNQRFERLDYQHRMHPEISKFSREHFYGREHGINELKDGHEINREWKYNRYSSHAIWLDVKRDPKQEQGNQRQNKNYTECNCILNELKKFILWAKSDAPQLTVAILTYYKPQEELIRNELQKYTGMKNSYSHFEKEDIKILLYTVDKFQGREADVVFLSMCRNKGIGFMDNINRLNVALTRAKYQRVIVGDRQCFMNQNFSQELSALAHESTTQNIKEGHYENRA